VRKALKKALYQEEAPHRKTNGKEANRI